MIQLTQDQHHALVNNGKGAAKVIDPVTNAEYVLLPADVYERLRDLIDDDLKVSDAYPVVARAVVELWNDPKMDDNERYEQLKK